MEHRKEELLFEEEIIHQEEEYQWEVHLFNLDQFLHLVQWLIHVVHLILLLLFIFHLLIHLHHHQLLLLHLFLLLIPLLIPFLLHKVALSLLLLYPIHLHHHPILIPHLIIPCNCSISRLFLSLIFNTGIINKIISHCCHFRVFRRILYSLYYCSISLFFVWLGVNYYTKITTRAYSSSNYSFQFANCTFFLCLAITLF